MPKTLRVIFLVIFWIIVIVGFGVAATALIFSALGYKYNFRSGTVEKTGTIYLKVTPKTADVYLNNELKSLKTPLKIPYLAAGTYQVKITEKGYLDWGKNILVSPEEVSSFDRVVLFLKDKPAKPLVAHVSSFQVSPNENFIAYVNKAQNKLYFYSMSSTQNKLAYTSKNRLKIISWAKNSSKILVSDTKDGAIAIDRADPTSKNTLRKSFGKNFTRLTWHPGDSNALYGLNNQRLYRLNLARNTLSRLKNYVLDFAVSNYDIFYIYAHSGIYRIGQVSFQGRNSQYITDPVDFSPKRVFTSENGRLALIDEAKTLHFLQKDNGNYTLEILRSDITAVTFGNPPGIFANLKGTESLLYSSSNEIGGFFKPRDPRFKSAENYLITRVSQTIQKINWYPDFNHVLYLADKEVHVVEMDGGNDTVLASNVLDFKVIDNGKTLIVQNGDGLEKITIRR